MNEETMDQYCSDYRSALQSFARDVREKVLRPDFREFASRIKSLLGPNGPFLEPSLSTDGVEDAEKEWLRETRNKPEPAHARWSERLNVSSNQPAKNTFHPERTSPNS